MSESLTWDGELLDVPGCIEADDLSPLRRFATRGTNLPAHASRGTRPYAPIPDELDTSLVWHVTGRFDHLGNPHADQEEGVEKNLEHYRALFTTGGDALTGEHDVILAYAGTTFTGLAQLREYAPIRTGPGSARIVTRVIIADSELEASGS